MSPQGISPSVLRRESFAHSNANFHQESSAREQASELKDRFSGKPIDLSARGTAGLDLERIVQTMPVFLTEIEVQLQQAKIEVAEGLLQKFERKYYHDLEPAIRQTLGKSDDYQVRLATSRFFKAKIDELKGASGEAQHSYQKILLLLDRVLSRGAKQAQALLLRAQVRDGLGDRPGALNDYQALAALNKKWANQPQDYRRLLEKRAIRQESALRDGAQHEKDPVKRLYFQSQVDLMDGKLAKAQLAMRDFVEQTRETKDPELLRLRDSLRGMLRKISLTAVEQLNQQNEMLLAQRINNPEMIFGAERAHRDNAAYLDELKKILASQRADTLDGAKEIYGTDQIAGRGCYEKERIVASGIRVWFNDKVVVNGHRDYEKYKQAERDLANAYETDPKDPTLFDTQSFPSTSSVRLEGGQLNFHVRSLTDSGPNVVRVIVGKGGGDIITPHKKHIYFPPSDRETVLIFKGGHMVPPPGLKRGSDYREEPISLLDQDFADTEFKILVNLHSRAGLEKMQSPEGRRQVLLETAQEIRKRNGCYAVAGEMLEELFSKELETALKTLPAEQKAQFQKEIEGERSKTEKQVKTQLDQLRKSESKTWIQRYPSGEPSADEVKGMVEASLKAKLEAKLKKAAFETIDAKYKANELSDPITQQAWKIYESMKDPLDKFFTISDEGMDRIVDEVVICAVTMPISMGAGAAVRGSLAGTTFFARFAARGALQAFAGRTAIWTAGSVTEGVLQQVTSPVLAMQMLHDLNGVSEKNRFSVEEQFRSIGWNIVMSAAFHGGGKLWGRAANAIGIGEKAVQAAALKGESAWGKLALYQSGTLVTQTTVGTGMGEIEIGMHDQDATHSFLERVGGHGARMVSMHYGMQAFHGATGRVIEREEKLAHLRLDQAHQAFQRYRGLGFSKVSAENLAVDYVANLSLPEEIRAPRLQPSRLLNFLSEMELPNGELNALATPLLLGVDTARNGHPTLSGVLLTLGLSFGVWAMVAGKRVLEDLHSINRGPDPFAARTPGLDRRTEARFEYGDSIERVAKSGKKKFLWKNGVDGTHEGAASEAEYRAYLAWHEKAGLPLGPVLGKDSAEARSLEESLKRHQIALNFEGELSGEQMNYVNSVLSLLPDSFFQNGYVRRLTLGVPYSQEAGAGDEFHNGDVRISQNTLNGSRRMLAATLIHELAHSVEIRYATKLSEIASIFIPDPELGLPLFPDATIPLEARETLHRYYESIRDKPRDAFVMNVFDDPGRQPWELMERPRRRAYTTESFHEFIPDLILQYVADGNGLRRFIMGPAQTDGAKRAYLGLYAEIRDRIFAGQEYDQRGPVPSGETAEASIAPQEFERAREHPLAPGKKPK